MEASKRKQNSSLGCANIVWGQMTGQADLPMAFPFLTLCLLLQRLMATAGPKGFKTGPILLGQAHNFFEATLSIKQPVYSGRTNQYNVQKDRQDSGN